MPDAPKRLTDDRGSLGSNFAHTPAVEDRDLGQSFADHQNTRADAELRDGQRLGDSFADPNAADDQKLGHAFEDSNRTRRHRHHAEPERKPKQPVNRRLLFLVVVVIVVLFLIVFLAGFLPRRRRNREIQQRAHEQQTALPVVEATTVHSTEHSAGLVVPGTTTPLVEAYVYARANGYLARRFADIGDRVHRGQLLAVIDAPDLDQQVDQAREQVRQSESQLAQQQTQLALAKITNDRWRVLVAKGVFSRQDGDQRDADYRAQLSNVAAAQRNVEAFRANLRRVIALQSYERVTAPFDGVVTQRNVDVGALISTQGGGQGDMQAPAQTAGTSQLGSTNTSGSSGNAPTAATPSTGGNGGGPLFAIAQIDRLRILVSVPEGSAGSIHLGQPVELHFQELPNATYYGKVTRTSASIDQNTRTLLTEVQVENPRRTLLSGMYTVASFAGPSGKGPLTISGDSVAVRDGRNIVAVIRDGTVHLQPVDLGRDFGPVVEVLGGLHEGDTIAALVTDDVQEGAKVNAQLQKREASSAPKPPSQSAPPGGPTQYGDQSITDQNMQGVAAQQGGKKGGAPKTNSKGETKQ